MLYLLAMVELELKNMHVYEGESLLTHCILKKHKTIDA